MRRHALFDANAPPAHRPPTRPKTPARSAKPPQHSPTPQHRCDASSSRARWCPHGVKWAQCDRGRRAPGQCPRVRRVQEAARQAREAQRHAQRTRGAQAARQHASPCSNEPAHRDVSRVSRALSRLVDTRLECVRESCCHRFPCRHERVLRVKIACPVAHLLAKGSQSGPGWLCFESNTQERVFSH